VVLVDVIGRATGMVTDAGITKLYCVEAAGDAGERITAVPCETPWAICIQLRPCITSGKKCNSG